MRPTRPSSEPSLDVVDTGAPSAGRVRDVVHETLAYAADRDYVGWDYADGMSSRVREFLPVDNRFVNLTLQETIKRSPVNIRPLLLVEQRRSFMGTGLFALAHRNLDRDPLRSARFDHASEATRLADWLVENRSPGYSGFCGGHQHENQHLDHRTSPEEPDVVSTACAVKGLLAAAEYDPSYADVARTAEEFLVEDMRYREVDGTARIDYYPKEPPEQNTLNVCAIAARTFLDLSEQFGPDSRLERAKALLDFVVKQQTERGGWYYRETPGNALLSMDTHHNGFIIECLLRYRTFADDDRYADAIVDGLEFFRETLFEDDGAPNWDESSSYPRDVHAAAQGVLVFTKAGYPEFARQIIDWTLDHLYAGDGRFHLRVHRVYRKRVTLMRWCQAWMSYALSTYLRSVLAR